MSLDDAVDDDPSKERSSAAASSIIATICSRMAFSWLASAFFVVKATGWIWTR